MIPTLKDKDHGFSLEIPPDYEPFENVQIGTLGLDHVRFLFKVGEYYPVLIGKGRMPIVWLQAPVGHPAKWVRLVERNVRLHDAVSVNLKNLILPTVEIEIENSMIIKIESINDEKIVIRNLDLRKLGMNIYLEDGDLVFGTNRVGEIGIKNAEIAFHFGT